MNRRIAKKWAKYIYGRKPIGVLRRAGMYRPHDCAESVKEGNRRRKMLRKIAQGHPDPWVQMKAADYATIPLQIIDTDPILFWGRPTRQHRIQNARRWAHHGLCPACGKDHMGVKS